MIKYPMKLRPVSKEIIWGGTKLKDEYGKSAPFDKIAESWELTVRNDGMSIIANGEYSGTSLDEYIAADSTGILGTASAQYDRFPLLIKFIDACDNLSVQVHPDNEYALSNEGELGKTEMWYIMDAKPGAKLVYGLIDGCTTDEFAEAVKCGDIEGKLNYVSVRPGEVYFIPSGQVHAIGAGILIAEIQQNSNITYRVYDYNRLGKDGLPRQLHVEKAIDVIKTRSSDEINSLRFSTESNIDSGELLASCDYFKSVRFDISDNENITLSCADDSFMSLLVLESNGGQLEYCNKSESLCKGDSFFIPAGIGDFKLTGSSKVIVTAVN